MMHQFFQIFIVELTEMDEFIHNKLQDYLNKTGCDTYTIKQGDEIVAMLSLGEDTLSLDDDDKDDMRSGFVPKPNIALDNKDFFAEKSSRPLKSPIWLLKRKKENRE